MGVEGWMSMRGVGAAALSGTMSKASNTRRSTSAADGSASPLRRDREPPVEEER